MILKKRKLSEIYAETAEIGSTSNSAPCCEETNKHITANNLIFEIYLTHFTFQLFFELFQSFNKGRG